MTESISLSAKTVTLASLLFTKKDVSGFQNYLAKTITTSIRIREILSAKMKNRIKYLSPGG
jgi:hypothetical protein